MVVAFDRELAFPPRCQQIGPGLWQLVLLDLVRVVRVHEHVLQGRGPLAVRGQREWSEIGKVRRADFLQQVRAAQDLGLR